MILVGRKAAAERRGPIANPAVDRWRPARGDLIERSDLLSGERVGSCPRRRRRYFTVGALSKAQLYLHNRAGDFVGAPAPS